MLGLSLRAFLTSPLRREGMRIEGEIALDFAAAEDDEDELDSSEEEGLDLAWRGVGLACGAALVVKRDVEARVEVGLLVEARCKSLKIELDTCLEDAGIGREAHRRTGRGRRVSCERANLDLPREASLRKAD